MDPATWVIYKEHLDRIIDDSRQRRAREADLRADTSESSAPSPELDDKIQENIQSIEDFLKTAKDLETLDNDLSDASLDFYRQFSDELKDIQAISRSLEITPSEFLNHFLDASEPPFTEERFANLNDTAFLQTARAFAEERLSAPIIGGFSLLDKHLDRYSGDNPELKNLSITPYQNGEYNAELDDKTLSVLGITQEEYRGAIRAEHIETVENMLKWRDESDYNAAHIIENRIDLIAELDHLDDPAIEIDAHRQIVMAELGISEEHLEQRLSLGAASEINEILSKWNAKPFQCRTSEDYAGAFDDNQIHKNQIIEIASERGWLDDSGNLDSAKLEAAGVNMTDLATFNDRASQLENSAEKPGRANFSRDVFGTETGCEIIKPEM